MPLSSRRALFRAVGCALALAASGCGEPAPDEPTSLLLIVIDTLRADHLGCYGYAFGTSPTIDSLAVRGTRFDRASTVAPITLPSITTMLTGRYPRNHGVRDNGFFALGEEIETLAERFRKAGFRTGAVVGSSVIAPDRGLAQGFEIYDAEFGGDFPVWDPTLKSFAEELGSTQRRATAVTDRALEVARQFDGEPFFLFVHYFDVHHHYDPPPQFAARHPGRFYDGEIAYTDSEISRLLPGVVRPGTMVVVVGDHGEAMQEHGEPEHGFLLHEATVHVPIVLAGPGVPSGVVRSDIVSLVDLEPTLARTFDLPSDGAPRDGRALDWKSTVDGPVFSETFRSLVSYGWSELRSVRRGDWKLVRGTDDELFNLRTDPHELNNLGAREPYAELSSLLDEIAEGDEPRAIYEAAHGAPDAQSREMLETLGYTSAEPAKIFPEHRPHPRDELPRWFQRQLAKVFLRSALHLMNQKKVEQAISLLDSTVVLDPELALAFALRGDCRLHREELEAARGDYQRALEIDSTFISARALLARVEFATGNQDAAFRLWERVLRAEPTNVDALRGTAIAHLQNNDVERSIPLLRRLLEVAPDDAEAHHNLGLAARELGDVEEATKHLTRFLELAPDHPAAGAIREMLAGKRPPPSAE